MLALLALTSVAAQAQTCTVCSSVTSGPWTTAATWGGFTPTTTATVTVNNTHTVSTSGATTVATLTVNAGGTLTLGGTTTVTTLTIAGTVNLNANATVSTLTISATGTLMGNSATPPTLTVGGGAGTDVTNNGSIQFQLQSGGVTLPMGYISLANSSVWTGSGTWNLFSINVLARTLTFVAGTTATINLGAATPFLRSTGSLTSQPGMTWNFNALGDQTIPSTSFTHAGIRTSGSGTKTVAGSLTVATTVTAPASIHVEAGTTWNGATNNPSMNVRSDVVIDGSFLSGTGTYTFVRTGAQQLTGSSGTVAFARLTLNNLTGLTISNSVSISTQLTLTAGQLTTSGAGTAVIIAADCTSGAAPMSRNTTLTNKAWVVGTLRLRFGLASSNCSYFLGDTTSYRPITAVTFSGVSAPFSVDGSSSQSTGDHPQIASAPILPARSVNRYWTLTNQGPGSPFTSYNATFNFLGTDDDAGTTPANFNVARYDGSDWTRETVNSATATTTRITGATGFGDFAIGEPGIDHYELAQPSSGLACLPATVTVTACADASSPCTNAASFVSGQTATLATSAGALGATALVFNAGGVASTTISYPAASNGAAATVTLSGESMPAVNPRKCCPDGTACVAANSCSTTFSTAGFVIAAAAGGAATTLPTQTAGITSGNFVLRAVKTSTTTAACEAALTGATTVDWAYECNDPATCSGSNLASVDGGSATTVQRNNDGSVGSYTAVPMTFDAGGNAPFSFTFNDVGQATLWMRKTVNSALLQGNSNAFVSKPAGFTVTGIAQTAAPNTANPGATGPAGGVFVKAGEAFRVTVTATTSSGAAAPNFGRESSPEGVRLTPALVLPAGGSSGALSNATIAGASFTNGVATVTNLAFSEVGVITLAPAVADGNYLGAGAVTGTATGNVGRFVPARFALSAPTLTHRAALACAPASAYTYLDENFRLTMTLTAQNSAGVTTTNYTGAFARFDAGDAAAWGLAGIDGSTVFSGGSGRLSLGSAAGSWSNGVLAGATLNAAALRGSAPDGPFDAIFGIAPTDPDGVALATLDLDTDTPANGADRATVATVTLRFGRLRLVNAIGAADRALALPLQAETWNGSGFALNTLDSCTTVPTSAVNLGRRRGSLTAADVTAAGPVTLVGGAGRLQLTAPAGGRSGTLDLALSLGATPTDAACVGPWTPTPAATAGAGLAALRSNWCSSAYAHDPAARATFGRQRTSGSTVHRRENF